MAKRRPTVLRVGTVSHGTMRPEDLIPSFIWEANGLRLSQAERDIVRRITRAMHVAGYYDSEQANNDCTVLFDILDAHCPDYCTFGAHEGDGSDYGVWPCLDALRDDPDVHQSPNLPGEDKAETWAAPKYWAHVNGHGNATLYRRAGNRWVECWSVV